MQGAGGVFAMWSRVREFGIRNSGFRVSGFGIRVWEFGIRVSEVGFGDYRARERAVGRVRQRPARRACVWGLGFKGVKFKVSD